MNIDMLPFNISLLVLTDANLKLMKPVKALDMFEASSRNFHPDGLFSTEIFGQSGTEIRQRTFAYIDLKIPVLHPTIFSTVVKLKSLYEEIMAGKSYAIWDEEIKDFERCSPDEGSTGYQFFIKHFQKIEFEQRKSTRRSYAIKLIEKYKKNCLLKHFIVLPAGLRDVEIGSDGRPTEDEINTLYRKALSISNLIPEGVVSRIPESADTTRYRLQLACNEIYDYIRNMVEGKKKLALGKWAGRNVFNSTRNVITTLNNDTEILGSPLTVSTNQTVIGLFQYLKGLLPVAMSKLRNGVLGETFPDPNSPAKLINKKTLKEELVTIKPSTFDEWMTDEGLEKVAQRFSIEDIRHSVLEIEGYYPALVYNDGKRFMVLKDIDHLPEGFDKTKVSPMTFAELIYLALFRDAHEYPGFVTRYPVANLGGIYPSWCYLKSTDKGHVLEEYSIDGQPTGVIAYEFPVRGETFFNSLSVSLEHLGRLGGDYDGDMVSFTLVYTDEARKEISDLLKSKKYYLDTSGGMNYRAGNDINELVLASMTG